LQTAEPNSRHKKSVRKNRSAFSDQDLGLTLRCFRSERRKFRPYPDPVKTDPVRTEMRANLWADFLTRTTTKKILLKVLRQLRPCRIRAKLRPWSQSFCQKWKSKKMFIFHMTTETHQHYREKDLVVLLRVALIHLFNHLCTEGCAEIVSQKYALNGQLPHNGHCF
jgi:hypothetical protein